MIYIYSSIYTVVWEPGVVWSGRESSTSAVPLFQGGVKMRYYIRKNLLDESATNSLYPKPYLFLNPCSHIFANTPTNIEVWAVLMM